MYRKAIILTAAALLSISGAAFTMRPGEDGLAPVERGDVVHLVVAPSVVEASSERVALAFEIPGTIREVLVAEGDHVEAGQVLARLDDRWMKARVARAAAELEAKRARRDAAIHGSRRGEVTEAEAALAAARSSAWERAQSLSRVEQLSARQAVSAQALDDAKSASDAARAQMEAADARLALVKEGLRAELKREAQAAVEGAAAELEEAQAYLAKTEIRAPIAGVILRRLAEPGEVITTSSPHIVVAMADLDRLELRTEIDENDVGRIAVGQKGYATADAYGQKEFPGTITRLTRELGRKTLRTDDPRAKNDTRVLEVIFQLEDPSALPLGLRMDVHVETVARHDVLTIPMTAVAGSGGDAQVTVLVDGERKKKKLRSARKTACAPRWSPGSAKES